MQLNVLIFVRKRVQRDGRKKLSEDEEEKGAIRKPIKLIKRTLINGRFLV